MNMTFARAALFALAAIPCVYAQSGKDIIKERMDRIQRFERKVERQQIAQQEIWSAQKTLANLEARAPVISVLGYFSAFDNQADKLTALRARLQPIAAEIALMAKQNHFQGTRFPSKLEERLAALRAAIFRAVADVYGEALSTEAQAYAQAAKPVFVP